MKIECAPLTNFLTTTSKSVVPCCPRNLSVAKHVVTGCIPRFLPGTPELHLGACSSYTWALPHWTIFQLKTGAAAFRSFSSTARIANVSLQLPWHCWTFLQTNFFIGSKHWKYQAHRCCWFRPNGSRHCIRCCQCIPTPGCLDGH